MPTLIDGYNLLYATTVASRTRGRTELERARLGLLDFLEHAISPQELAATTIVFDAANAPPGLPAHSEHAGMTVLFARDHDSADDMIEHLVEQSHSPKNLVVVSSDHRVQRAAKRRKAMAIDSERWMRELLSNKRNLQSTHEEESKPNATPSAAEVDFWLPQFLEETEHQDNRPTGRMKKQMRAKRKK